jgi:hypothetical protein
MGPFELIFSLFYLCFMVLNFSYVSLFLGQRLGEHICDVYISLWLKILRKVVMEFLYDLSNKKQLNLDFDVKCTTIHFHGKSHNSQSDNWMWLKLYVESPNMLSYPGLKVSVNRISGRHCNTGQHRLYKFVIYFLLTCGLSIWLRFFFYKDMIACFRNLLVLKGSLMGCNIVSRCDKDS